MTHVHDTHNTHNHNTYGPLGEGHNLHSFITNSTLFCSFTMLSSVSHTTFRILFSLVLHVIEWNYIGANWPHAVIGHCRLCHNIDIPGNSMSFSVAEYHKARTHTLLLQWSLSASAEGTLSSSRSASHPHSSPDYVWRYPGQYTFHPEWYTACGSCRLEHKSTQTAWVLTLHQWRACSSCCRWCLM